jgi:uncharacterized protein (TIGR03083 family)
VHLFPVLHALLIDLLRSLRPEDWQKPTLAPLWAVKDIAAHLLDVNMRAISARDNYGSKQTSNISSYHDLVNYLNELNATWVKAMDRVSPQQLINLLETTGREHSLYLATLAPFAPAQFPIAWAGEEHSANWFHIAREYTEKWHHQQQIRDAVGKPGLMTKELFYPCIDTFMQGLPYNYCKVAADTGTLIKITISGEEGGTWYLQKAVDGWALQQDQVERIFEASVTLPADVAWRLFTKGIQPATAKESSIIIGNKALASNLFPMIAVMA